MINEKGYIPEDLVIEFQNSVKEILKNMKITHADLSNFCGWSRTSLATILNRQDRHVTVSQFLTICCAIEYLTKEIINKTLNKPFLTLSDLPCEEQMRYMNAMTSNYVVFCLLKNYGDRFLNWKEDD